MVLKRQWIRPGHGGSVYSWSASRREWVADSSQAECIIIPSLPGLTCCKLCFLPITLHERSLKSLALGPLTQRLLYRVKELKVTSWRAE